MEIGPIREALAATLADALDIQTYARGVLNPDPPAAMVRPAPFGPEMTYDGESNIRLLLTLMASSVDFEGGQDRLDGWISTTGANSVKVALDKNARLNRTCESCLWMGITEYGPMQLSDGGTIYLAAVCNIDILAS